LAGIHNHRRGWPNELPARGAVAEAMKQVTFKKKEQLAVGNNCPGIE
jgi:hypothetical protein